MNMKNLLLLFAGLLSLATCGHRHGITDLYSSDEELFDTIITTTVTAKDSIDCIIEERSKISLYQSIYGGLFFGDNKKTVERVMANSHLQKIRVPDGEEVRSVSIKTYDAEFKDDKLVSLVLYFEEDELFSALKTLYTTKYGPTKNGVWEYADCTISIEYGHREQYDRSYDLGYGRSGGTPMYFENMRCTYGNNAYPGTPMTTDPFFLKVCYKNNSLIEMLRQKAYYIQDTLASKEYFINKEEERQLAHRLATEPATNI